MQTRGLEHAQGVCGGVSWAEALRDFREVAVGGGAWQLLTGDARAARLGRPGGFGGGRRDAGAAERQRRARAPVAGLARRPRGRQLGSVVSGKAPALWGLVPKLA